MALHKSDLACHSCGLKDACRSCGLPLDRVYGVMRTMDHTASAKIISTVHGIEPRAGQFLLKHLMSFHDDCLTHRNRLFLHT
jgi:hypothetical protein